MLLFGISGACIAGVPLALMLMIQSFRTASLDRQLNHYRELEEQGLYLNVWMLKKDINSGEKVKRADLEKHRQWVSEEDSIKIADISQISGKAAVKALKKGTMIETEMFYPKTKKKLKNKS